MINNYDDIYRMHQHHSLPISTSPTFLSSSDQVFREGFLREELLEFEAACRAKNIGTAADALIDLVVVAMGTAVMMGLPWHALWRDVLRSNMAKERVNRTKLIKPKGWQPPHSHSIIGHFSGENGVPAPAIGERPRVVCLCGSTRFKAEYEHWARHYAFEGVVVLTVGFFMHADEEVIDETTKAGLDQLHLHKIDMADEVFIINPGGYIGESTLSEIEYAESRGIEVRYLVTTSVVQ